MPIPWTFAEAVAFLALREAGVIYNDVPGIMVSLGYPERSRKAYEIAMEGRAQDIVARGPEVPEVEAEDVEPLPADHPDVMRVETANQKLRDDVMDLKSKLRAAHRENTAIEFAAQVVSEEVQPLEPVPIITREKKEGTTPVDAVALLSDEHSDEMLHPAAAWGLDAYDFDIFRCRLQRWAEELTQYLTTHLPAHDFERLWVFKLGDSVNGDIHNMKDKNHFANTLKASMATGDAEAHALQFIARETGLPIHVVSVSGNHPRRCLDDQTEVLTRRGWLSYTDITTKDEVFGVSPTQDRRGGQPVEGVPVYDSPGHILEAQGRTINFGVTEEHRFLVKPKSKQKGEHPYRFVNVRELSQYAKIPVSVQNTQEGCGLNEAEIRLSAWLLTDGHITYPNTYRYIGFTQRESNKENITKWLDVLGMEYTETPRKRRDVVIDGKPVSAESQEVSYDIRVRAESSRRFKEFCSEKGQLPEWAWRMDAKEFSWFLDSFVDGDGTWKTPRSAVIYGKGQVMHELQALCIMNGWKANLLEDKRAAPGNYRLTMSRRTMVELSQPIAEVPYNGEVWCLTVRFGNFLVRRKGKAHFTGNSRRKSYEGPHDNFDYLVTSQIATRLQNQESIDIVAPEAWTAFVDVRGHLCALNHGDDIRGTWGIPWYGVNRRANRIQALVAKKGVQIRYFFYGHFHEVANVPVSGADARFNGPFPMTSPFSLDGLALATDPAQSVFFVSDKGIILQADLWVRDLDREEAFRAGAFEPSFGTTTILDELEPPGSPIGQLDVIRV